MQGKFDSSHSKSTSLVRVVKRFALDALFLFSSPLCFFISLLLYFFTVRSAVAPLAVTSTACVVGFPSSLQVFSVYLPGGTFLIS